MTNQHTGWTNYVTQLVNSHLTNYEELADECATQAGILLTIAESQAKDDGEDATERAVVAMTTWLEQMLDAEQDSLELPPLWQDLVSYALSQVAWDEIADAFISGAGG